MTGDSWWAKVASLGRNLFVRRRLERELDEELRAYLDLLVAEKVAAGLTPKAARRAALLELEGTEQVKEAVRDVRTGAWLGALKRDLVGAARSLVRGRWTAPVIAVLTLALGIAATTTVFSAVYGVLLRPLNLPQPGQLAFVLTRYLPESGYDFPFSAMSGPEFLDFRAQNRTFSSVAALQGRAFNVGSRSGSPIRAQGMAGTPNLFQVLGVSPLLGRGFVSSDGAPGAPCAVVLSHGLWRDQFGQDRGIVERDVDIDGRPCRVAGVMPEGFAFPDPNVRLWIALALDPAGPYWHRQNHGYFGVGRLREGVSSEAVQADLNAIASLWARDLPDHHKGHFAVTQDLLESLVGSTEATLLLLFGAVTLVLIGVCVNLVGVNLARSEARRRETAVRLALGGRPADIVRQLMLESLLLSSAGGLVGWFLARGLGGRLIASFPGGLPRSEAVALDGWAWLFAVGMTIIVGIGLGFASALASSRVRLDEALQAGARQLSGDRRGLRARSVLVVAQVGLGLALSLTSGWLIQSYAGLRRVELGFDARQTVTFAVDLSEGTIPEESRARATITAIIERLQAIPGVTGAAAISDVPFVTLGPANDFHIENRPDPGRDRGFNGRYLTVSPGIFEVLRIPLVDGRLLSDGDGTGSPLVAVINQTARERYFAGQNPLGQRIRYFGETEPWLTIVGVVGDVRAERPNVPAEPAIYVSHGQQTRDLPIVRSLNFVVRTPARVATVAPAIHAAVAATAPTIPVARLRSMGEIVDTALGSTTFAMRLMTAFAAAVLALAALGIYGLLAHAVVTREKEIGLRMALGATRSMVWLEVLRVGIRLTAIGIGLGLLLALAMSPLFAKLLFEVRVTDPRAILAAAGILLAVAGVACGVPAFRAARVEPMRSLRAS